MATTIITKDGKCHVLVGNTTAASIIRDYLGEDILGTLRRQVSDLCDEIECVSEMSEMDLEEIDSINNALESIKNIFI